MHSFPLLQRHVVGSAFVFDLENEVGAAAPFRIGTQKSFNLRICSDDRIIRSFNMRSNLLYFRSGAVGPNDFNRRTGYVGFYGEDSRIVHVYFFAMRVKPTYPLLNRIYSVAEVKTTFRLFLFERWC